MNNSDRDCEYCEYYGQCKECECLLDYIIKDKTYKRVIHKQKLMKIKQDDR